MRVNGTCAKVRERRRGAGRKCVIVGEPVTVGIKWTPIVWKGAGVPTFIKTSAIKVITRKEYNQ